MKLDAHIGGSYAGFMLFPLHGSGGQSAHWPVQAQIAVPGLGLGRDFAIAIATEGMRAGRYRLVLFTDGPAVITVPTAGTGTIHVHPTAPVRSFGRLLQVAPTTLHTRLDGDPGVRLVSGFWNEYGYATASSSDAGASLAQNVCVTTASSCDPKALAGAGVLAGMPSGQGGSPLGYRRFTGGEDTVDVGVPRGRWLRLDSTDINARNAAFVWGVD
jgi:hypothetical protein